MSNEIKFIPVCPFDSPSIIDAYFMTVHVKQLFIHLTIFLFSQHKTFHIKENNKNTTELIKTFLFD